MKNRIARIRIAFGLSQSKLAEKAGISRQHLSSVEKGLTVPSAAVARRICSALGVTFEQAFGDEGVSISIA